MSDSNFDNELSERVWKNKYRRAGDSERTIVDTWRRVATAVASVEAENRDAWSSRFLAAMIDFRFLPAGRIMAAAGARDGRTLFNCFVSGSIEDNVAGIFDRLKEAALTMQAGGGIGCDFSTLRPRGSSAREHETIASGPVSFMSLWDSMCATLLSTGARRGAMMGTLRCDHPDIEEFIDVKRDARLLRNFNLSVQISDAFMHAVARDEDWPLAFPVRADDDRGTVPGEILQLSWPGFDGVVACRVHRRLPARALWRRLLDAAYDSAEPGVLFIDRINLENNLRYRERIGTTNPCGEIPLPPFAACNLGSINLAAFVDRPFSGRARLDIEGVGSAAALATRFLDNVVDLSAFPLAEQAAEARGSRRIGLGVTGLADALIMLGLRYDSEPGRALAVRALGAIRDAAYRSSIALAREKGGCAYFDRDAYLSGAYIGRLAEDIQDGIATYGIRNSHLIAIAPAGSISVVANNVSSGIEPVFDMQMERRVYDRSGTPVVHRAVDHAYACWRRREKPGAALPEAFVMARDIPVEAHLAMQAALQPLVDNAISKTVNVAADIGRPEFESIYRQAFELGLKGCTVFRPNPVTGELLSSLDRGADRHCCAIDREGD